jgi:hypothetical protein
MLHLQFEEGSTSTFHFCQKQKNVIGLVSPVKQSF